MEADPGTAQGPDGPDGPRRRRLLSLARPLRPPGRCARMCCCCCGCGVGAAGGANKVLPVTLAPTDCDYLEIRPHRRIRVVHLYGKNPTAAAASKSSPDSAAAAGPNDHRHRSLHRSATTISRPDVGDDDHHLADGGGATVENGLHLRLPSPRGRGTVESEEDEEEDYWFENAAPRRMPIRPQQSSSSRHPPNRIFNKFEPQRPPSIAGINPPRASVARAEGEGVHAAASAAAAAANASPEQQQQQQGPSPTHQQRLQRKVILPVTQDDEEEEDLVREAPGAGEPGMQNGASSDLEEDGEGGSPPKSSSPIMEENFVANVLADMSGLVLNITADATDARPTPVRSASAPGATETEESHSSTPTRTVVSVDAASPTLDRRTVMSSPDPDDPDGPGNVAGAVATGGKVIVTGGNLGGVANVAFEEEEVIDYTEESQDTHQNTASAASEDSTDAGYTRRRDLSEHLLINGEGGNHGDSSSSSSDEDEGQPPPTDPKSESVPMKTLSTSPSTFANGGGGEAHLNDPSSNNIPTESNAFPMPLDSNGQPLQHQPLQPTPSHTMLMRPCLFFIHGVGGSATTWTTQLEYFTSRGYEVVAPDLLGHGFSSAPDNPRSYTFAKLFRDIMVTFDHYVRGDRVCCLVAHSYGTSFAAALARARPHNVKTLLLLASGGPTPLMPPPVIRSVPAAFVDACLKPFLRCGFRRQQQYSASSGAASGGKGAAAKDENARGKAMKFQEAFDVPAYVFKHIMAGQTWPEGDANFHRRITCPTLLVYGLKDPFVSLVEMCEMERTIPKSYLELLPLAGHMVMLDQPRELNAMMRRFVEKYNPSPGEKNTQPRR